MKKFLVIAISAISFIGLTNSVCATRIDEEAILSSTYNALPPHPGNPNIHDLNQAGFNAVFPVLAPRNISVGALDTQVEVGGGLCGGRRTVSANGTGVLISSQPDLGNPARYEIEGLTALHVLGTATRTWNLGWDFGQRSGFTSLGRNTMFYPGQRGVQITDPITGHVDYILHRPYQVNVTQVKRYQGNHALDICLFLGDCDAVTGAILATHTSNVALNLLVNNAQQLDMIHYPNSCYEQRINNNTSLLGAINNSLIQGNNLIYEIDSLNGSSGSPLFANGDIVAIHGGSDHPHGINRVDYLGERFPVAPANRGVLINQLMVNNMRGQNAFNI